MRRRRYRKDRYERRYALLITFGLGLLLALVCSPRLVLLILAIALIYVGYSSRC